MDDRDIRTTAYPYPIKVMTVKNLLGSCVTVLALTADFLLLGRDDRANLIRIMIFEDE